MKKRKIVLISVLAVLAVVLAAAVIFYARISNPKNVFSDVLQSQTPSPTPAQTVLPEPSATAPATPSPNQPTPSPEPTIDLMEAVAEQADAEFAKNRVNILILGLDESAERANWGSFRTDTMMLLSLDFDENDVDLISLPRDSYVRIFNTEKYAKINSAFPTGGGAKKNGYQYASETVSSALGGVKVHYYVAFNMQVVKDVANAMGGVDYDVDVPVTMNGRTLSPGFQHLDGQAVLDYCRQRKGSSDIARIDRQQRMMMALFSQLKRTNQIFNIPAIYQAVAANIDTSLSFEQVCSLALFAAKLDVSSIDRHTLPGKGMNYENSSIWVLDMAGVKKIVQDVFGIRNPKIDWEMDVSALNARIAETQKQLAALQIRVEEQTARAAQLYADHPALAGVFDSRILHLEALLQDGDAEELATAVDAFEAFMDQKAAAFEEAPPEDDELLPDDLLSFEDDGGAEDETEEDLIQIDE